MVVFVRSQIHSYAYHLVSVRRHNQHVRSPIQGFFRCEGISFIPRVQQRSTFPRLPPQERQNYITSPRPVSTAPLAPVRGSGVGNKEHPTPLCLSVLPTYPQVVLPTAPKGVLPKTPKGSGDCPQKVVGTIYRRLNNSPTAPFQRSAVHQATLRRTFDNSPPYFDASRAESRVKQGGEFRHIGRRFSPWTTEILIEQGGVMADVTKGIARTAPLNAWNDGKTAVLRQSPQPPEQARGV